ncbi:MAG: hypothetical protein Q8S24_04940 [Eubacteriales bacterium]|nr:hypothetical protein [Eubacteriales bacterium]
MPRVYRVARQTALQKFNVSEQVKAFHDISGEILACGTCLKSRSMDGTEVYPINTVTF